MSQPITRPGGTAPAWALVACRALFLLGLVVWLGGLSFVAVAAPAMFKVSRVFGPRMVGAAMAVFTPVTYACGLLILIGWLGERVCGAFPYKALDKIWGVLGLCVFMMLGLGAYCGLVVMPAMVKLQPVVVAERASQLRNTSDSSATPGTASVARTTFDQAHKQYALLTSALVWLGLVAIVLFCVRSSQSLRRRPDVDDGLSAIN